MLGFINEVSTGALFNILSIIIGCVISFPLYRFLSGQAIKMRASALGEILIIIAAAVVGSIIPLGTYGIIPLVAAACSAKCKNYLILPFIISNFIFNMTVPIAETNFTWKTGPNRIMLACLAGIFAGVIAKILSKKMENTLFHTRLLGITAKEEGFKGILNSIKVCIESVVMFVVVGVILNSVFHRFIMYDALKTVYSSAFGLAAFKYMNDYDIMNPMFVLTLTIVNNLIDITKLSALAFMFRVKGIAAYLLYFIALAAILASSIYFV